MMQFTEIIPISTMNYKTQKLHRIIKPSNVFQKPPLLSNNNNLGDANCNMEQLLIHCAQAIENNDATPAQQILWVLNNIAPPDGDSNQRLTRAFLRTLILRATYSAANNGGCSLNLSNNILNPHKFSLIELANFVDLTPWHRFGFTSANSIIIDAIDEHPIVHIVDISVTHCMQIPTLIDSIATTYGGRGVAPPLIRLTVAAIVELVPPLFDLLSYDELGLRLINFARTRNVSLEFTAVPTTPSDGFAAVIDAVRHHRKSSYNHHQEAVIINAHMSLHYLLQEEDDEFIMTSSMRTLFLEAVRGLDPTMVVIVEEDVDFTARDLVGRVKSAFDYLWIPFDTVDTCLPRGSKQREWYEAEICWKIENVVGHEGRRRVERQERRARWRQRLREAEFAAVEFREEAVAEVKGMLEEHAAGWGSKKEDQDLVLTWKGHNVVFATAWVPT